MARSMESLAITTFDKMLLLAPAALVFAIVALAVKRNRVWAAFTDARNETLTNIGLLAINTLALVPLLVLPTERWNDAIALFTSAAAFWDRQPVIFALAATLLTGEFVVYWRHRVEHSRVLWPIHAVHHSDTAMTWLALLRKHPLSYAFSLFVDISLLLLLGLPAWTIAACALARTWWGYFIHADLPWTLGVLGNWLISPAAHRLHHIDDLELCGSNYGGMLTVWDRVFGTYVDPEPYKNCTTGVAGGSRGLAGELTRPFAMWSETARTKRKPDPQVVAET